ncbi:hypothetical protein [Actinomyces howellii]|uniref:Uncharacterized protein n=1 Tax=Actinomyces howellii TaxID=52771 RepID=A0A448HI28_9ACTO|nr:hypothetical protein [Actinomyces howellii]VEG28982.1 Uncharacterised protein [Actinomyces howellii]
MIRHLSSIHIAATRLSDRVRSHLEKEEGASTVEWVIITGFLIILAAVVGRAVYAMVQGAADGLSLPGID